MTYDLLLKNVSVVRPQGSEVHEQDIAIKGGKFAKIAGAIPARDARPLYVEPPSVRPPA